MSIDRNLETQTEFKRLSRWEWLALAACLAIFVIQPALSSPHKSASFDEQYHLAAGYAYLKTGDFRLSRTVGHPPLANLLNAIPLLFLDDVELPLDHPAWQNGDFQWFADTFLWQVNDNPQQLINLSRYGSMALGVFTTLILFIWARQLVGPAAGWLALLLAVFDPNLLANARLITTDLALAFFVLLAIWRLWAWLRRPTPLNLFLTALAIGLAMATKYTALLLLPIILSILLIYPGLTWRRLGNFVLMGLVSYVVVWAVYGFDIGPISSNGSFVPVPAPAYPESVWQTFSYINEQPVPAYMLGRISTDGWRTYFPLTLAVKTPLPLLILAVAGLFCGLYYRGWRKTSVLWLPPLAFMVLAMLGRFNIGYRHIIQVVPFLIMMASYSVRLPTLVKEWRKTNKRGIRRADPGPLTDERSGRQRAKISPHAVSLLTIAGLILLVIWLVTATIRLYPHHEAYFNELVGGPENGGEILVDSNIDWGQDLPALKELMAELDIEKVNLAYFGTAVPEAYGVRYKPAPGFIRFTGGSEVNAFNPYTPEPGWYAISETSLRLGLVRQNFDIYAYFAAQEPIAKAGYSINLYEVTYPETLPTERMIVTGKPVADMDPEELGIRPEERVIVKWTESPQITILSPAPAELPPEVEEMSLDFEGQFNLIGYRLDNSIYEPGEAIELTLYWQVGSTPVETPRPAMGNPLASFIHLTGSESSEIVAQYDGWGAALSTLETGDVVVQNASILIPEQTPPGPYELVTGLYSPQTSQRVSTTLDGAQTDAVQLIEILITGID